MAIIWILPGYDQPFTFYLEVNVLSFQVFQNSSKAQISPNLAVAGIVGWRSGGINHFHIIPSCQLTQDIAEAGACEIEEPSLPGDDFICIDVLCHRYSSILIENALLIGG